MRGVEVSQEAQASAPNAGHADGRCCPAATRGSRQLPRARLCTHACVSWRACSRAAHASGGHVNRGSRAAHASFGHGSPAGQQLHRRAHRRCRVAHRPQQQLHRRAHGRCRIAHRPDLRRCGARVVRPVARAAAWHRRKHLLMAVRGRCYGHVAVASAAGAAAAGDGGVGTGGTGEARVPTSAAPCSAGSDSAVQ